MDMNLFLEQISEAVRQSWAGPKIFWQYFSAILLFLVLLLGFIYRKTIFSELKNSRKKKSRKSSTGFILSEDSVLEQLIQKKILLSIHLDDGSFRPLGQCVLSRLDQGLLRCEVTAGTENLRNISPGTDIVCFFSKFCIDNEPVNSLKTALHSLTSAGSLIFEKPESYGFFHRRHDKRKKILSQAYLRLNLWAFDPEKGPAHYMSAPPDISVNSYLAPSEVHLETRVVNISEGGLAVQAPLEISDKFKNDMTMALNLNLFSAKQKIFKTKWITAKIRSISPSGDGTARMGMEFVGRIQK